jgi:hypothetical protein
LSALVATQCMRPRELSGKGAGQQTVWVVLGETISWHKDNDVLNYENISDGPWLSVLSLKCLSAFQPALKQWASLPHPIAALQTRNSCRSQGSTLSCHLACIRYLALPQRVQYMVELH